MVIPNNKSPSGRDDAYFSALGRFISQFAAIESLMLQLLHVESGLDSGEAEAIFNSTRINDAKDTINRLREAHGRPESLGLQRAFSQLTVITKFRNDLVHYGAQDFGKQGLWITNASVIHTASRLRMAHVSVKILNDLCHDLFTIGVSITAHITERLMDDVESELVSNGTRKRKRQPLKNTELLKAAPVPFRYKPVEPSPALKRSQTTHLKRPPTRTAPPKLPQSLHPKTKGQK